MSLLSYRFSLTPRKSQREGVQRLEDFLSQSPQVECPVTNHFAPGVYIREMFIPAGTVATGAVHKTEHLTIVCGHCHLTTDEGTKEFVGCNTVHSKPGIKRAIATMTDTTVWTVHATTETDLSKLVEELTESKADELLGGSQNRQLLANKREELEA